MRRISPSAKVAALVTVVAMFVASCAPASPPAPTAAPKATEAPKSAAAAPAPVTSPAVAAPAPAAASPAAAAPVAQPATSPVAKAAPTLGPGPKIKITWVGHVTPTLPHHVRIDKPYAEQIIPQRSGGRIEIDVKTHPELGLKGDEVLRMVRQHQTDIGATIPAYVAGDVPLLDVADLAGLNPTIDHARKVMKAVTGPVNSELEKFGVKQVMTFGNPAQVIFCRQPISGWDDLNGKKIRTFGTSLPELVVAAGGQSVNIAFAEVYTALERGVADCAITGTGSANSSKWYEVTTHMYTLPLSWSVGAFYVNLEWWNKLDPDVRQFLEATFSEMEEQYWNLANELTQDGIDCNTGRPTCKLGTPDTDSPMVEVKPTDQDLARVKTILQETILPSWVSRCGERCIETYSNVVAPISGVPYVKR